MKTNLTLLDISNSLKIPDAINGMAENFSVVNSTDSHTRKAASPFWGLEYTILSVILAVLAITGIIGNVSVLLVYFRRRDNLVTNTFIKVLAFVDLLVCSFVIPYTIVYELHLVKSDIACRVCEFIRHVCIFSSNITLVAVATERYIAVCKIGTKLNVNSIRVGIKVIFGLSTILGVPAVGTFAVVEGKEVQDINCRYPHEDSSESFCHFTYTIMGKTLVLIYQSISAVLFYISVFIITVLYSIIYYVLWQKRLVRRKILSGTAQKIGTDICSRISNGNHCNPRGNIRTQIHLRRFVRTSSSCSSYSKMDINDPYVDVSSETVTDNLVERNDFLNAAQNSQEETIKIRSDPAVKKGQQHCRKIRFSVSAQVGRSEILKRKKYYHKRTAKMLFLCTVIYFVTWLPFWIDIFGLTNCLILRYLFFIGNATNPIVYGIVNEQIRRAFERLFFDCLTKWFRLGKDS